MDEIIYNSLLFILTSSANDEAIANMIHMLESERNTKSGQKIPQIQKADEQEQKPQNSPNRIVEI